MIDKRTGKDLKDIPILEEPQLRIYVMIDGEGRVKIGKTKNIYQRYLSLCGSNGKGQNPVSVCCSPPTYLYSLETIMHNKFARYRIPNTEWFFNKENPNGEQLFEEACKELRLLFSSTDYKKCNELRKSIYLNENKAGDTCDD
jgi:hypothetical protein